MANVIIELEQQEVMKLESILMDNDEEEALLFKRGAETQIKEKRINHSR